MAKSVIPFSICTVFLFLVATARADDFQCPDNSTAITRLKSHVFCNYDPYIRPVRLYNETVDVRLRLVLKKIHFDEKRDTVHVYSLFGLIWTDYHLLWNPAEYENIEELRVSSYSLWTPDIGVYTSADETSFTPYMRPTICIVHSDGKVNCVPPSRHTASCSADLTRWPYDTHTCDLVLGSWTHTGEKVNISLMKPSIYLHDYNMNREWELVSMTSYRESGRFPCCPNDTYPAVIFQIVLQRHSGSYTAIVVAPAIVLILMTLVTWMKGDQSDRMIFAITDVFAHFLFLQYLGNILPPNGDSSPLIVTFYRDSMFLATMAVLTTVIVRGLRKASGSPPVWISGLSSLVLQNRFGQILIFHSLDPKGAAAVSETSGDEGDSLVDGADSQASSSWTTFTSLLDVTCLVVALVTYFVLLLGFIP
ncbi:neuronal acetylcholine receptor subunit alpha-2-like [Cryptotermes secundus]|uniref:neuronal acetylcholine receptor subunit alpha-2-like n=1 Tax=Cryptotermes secundus TaxID=105785 RepID=UPI000CD7C0DB|nr:neuronal acetylcholine receptor subunit alpha-2-like [Cryptotermes secundus]